MEPTKQAAYSAAGTLEELIAVLREQKGVYDELLALSREKQQILIKGDIAALEGVTAREEGLVFRVGKTEEKRERCFTSLAKVYGLTPGITLADFLPFIDEQSRAVLEQLHRDFSLCLDELRKLNQGNTDLLEQSIQFVNFTADSLTCQSKPVYNAENEVRVETLTNLLDKKA